MIFVFEVNMFQEKDLSFFHVFVSLFFTFPVWSLLGSFWGCGWIDVEAWKRIWRRWPETWSIASHSRSRESGRSLTGNQLYLLNVSVTFLSFCLHRILVAWLQTSSKDSQVEKNEKRKNLRDFFLMLTADFTMFPQASLEEQLAGFDCHKHKNARNAHRLRD